MIRVHSSTVCRRQLSFRTSPSRILFKQYSTRRPIPEVFSRLPSVDILLPHSPPIQKCASLTRAVLRNATTRQVPLPAQQKQHHDNHNETMIYVCREDINSAISPAGNKLRKLSYVLPHALSDPNLKTVVTVGSVQSNCCRQAAAVAAKLGLKCIVVLTQEVDPQHQNTELYNAVGNVQLERLLGADVRILGPSSRHGARNSAEIDGREWSRMAHDLSEEDADGAYFLSQGASGNQGAGIGYAKWVFDMLEKESVLREDGVLQGSGVFDIIVVACATGGTLAGMIAGMCLAEKDGYVNPQKRRHLVGVETFAKDLNGQRDIVLGIAQDTASSIGLRREDVRVENVVVDGRWTAGGYGMYDELTRQTIKMVARTEAMFLDPVYTGKAMTAVVEGIRTGELHGNVLFVHTGGSPVLPAYLGIEQA